jgi:hypothetical protein
MKQREAKWLELRREAVRQSDAAYSPESAPIVGCGLSGGGIRSATFCLGLFQALSRAGLLRRIDYLSTVSGGGYFGSAFAALFTRGQTNPKAEEETLTGGPSAVATGESDFVGNLRENGRYLSPNGSGDFLLGGAVILRNWVAVQVVLLTLVIALLLFAQVLAALTHQWTWPYLANSESTWAWWSPWWIPAGWLFLFGAFPAGWAYWFAGRQRGLPAFVGGAAAGALGLVLTLGITLPAYLTIPFQARIGVVLFVTSLEALIIWQLSRLFLGELDAVSRDLDHLRRLSSLVKSFLIVTAVFGSLALVDTCARTLYLRLHDGSVTSWIGGGGLASLVAALAAFSYRIGVRFGDGKKAGGRPSIPLSLVAGAAAVLLVLVLGVVCDLGALACLWRLGEPGPVPAALVRQVEPDATSTLLQTSLKERQLTVDLRLHGESHPPIGAAAATEAPTPPVLALVIAFGFSFLFGQSWTFLNRSSHHSLYSARLTRAYLGASNRKRRPGASLSKVVKEDAPLLSNYFSEATFKNGAPLHLINVTVNETVFGKNKVQQQDRKGVGLALGPAGFHLGPQRHLAVSWAMRPDGSEDQCTDSSSIEPKEWTVFRRGKSELEFLNLGSWIGISGAAFTTGIGYRTSLGLSLLSGFGNVRLGYWWRPGITTAPDIPPIEKFMFWTFPVQCYLLSEFFARFPGTALPGWYLSDGGHFENLGGYELIRRRLKRIILIDAECDGDYTFGGLANLIRKARIDFGAEITFWCKKRFVEPETPGADGGSTEPIEGRIDPSRLGTLDDLHRDMPEADSRAYAAVADVRYEGEERASGRLLYIKPALCGSESADVRNYHSTHPDFPHESTADQFFDEAQWESYRRLGEIEGDALFGPGSADESRVFREFMSDFFGASS